MIHLDTSFLIRALVAGTPQEARLLQWFDGPEPVGLSAVAWAEFLCGPVSAEASTLARTLLGDPAPLDMATAERAAQLFKAPVPGGAACSIASSRRRRSKRARRLPPRTRATLSASRARG